MLSLSTQHNDLGHSGLQPGPLLSNNSIGFPQVSETDKHRPAMTLGSMKNEAETNMYQLHVNVLTSQRHLQADRKNTPVDGRNNNELLSDFLQAVCFHSCTAQTPV